MARRAKEHDSFSHSMTDLMAGVAVMFLLIAAIFMVQVARSDAKEKEAGKKAAEQLRKITHTDKLAIAALLSLRASLTSNVDLEVEYDETSDPFLLTIVFDRNRLRFRDGDCAISGDMRREMDATFRAVLGSVCAVDSKFIQSITLEGHTDSRPFLPAERTCGVEPARRRCSQDTQDPECQALGFENNVRLSAARAQNVFFEMRGMLGSREDIARCLDTKFVVAGRGPVDPVDGGDWKTPRDAAQNERNRRVVIKVRAVARSSATAEAVP